MSEIEKQVWINGRDHRLRFEETDYEDIVIRALGYRSGDIPKGLSVTYTMGKKGQSGSLVYGGPGVRLNDGMIFNVVSTSAA